MRSALQLLQSSRQRDSVFVVGRLVVSLLPAIYQPAYQSLTDRSSTSLSSPSPVP